jgi:hypothetical protein
MTATAFRAKKTADQTLVFDNSAELRAWSYNIVPDPSCDLLLYLEEFVHYGGRFASHVYTGDAVHVW